jgi:hypothetical protein
LWENDGGSSALEIFTLEGEISDPDLRTGARLNVVWTGSVEHDRGNVGRDIAWQIHDLIYNEVYGLGPYFDDSLKVSTKFQELSDYANQKVPDGKLCTEKRFLSDVIVEGIVDPWDMLQELLRSAHAFPLVAGAQIWPAVEKTGSPVMSFGMDNVAKDDKGNSLFTESWRTFGDTPNVVEVQYFDESKDYIREVARYPDDDSLIPTGEKIQKLSAIFHNVSRRSQAKRLANYYWLIAQNVKRFIQFSTEEEAVALQPGDIFYFSHDIPRFDYSGNLFRIRDGKWLELDNDWDDVEPSVYNYKILVRDRDDDTIEIKDIGGIDDYIRDGGRLVVRYSGDFSFTPAEGDSYILIEANTTPISYVCTELSRDEDLRRVISAKEYVSGIFNYDLATVEEIDYVSVPGMYSPPSDPTDLTLTEMPQQEGFYINAVKPTDLSYDHSRIFLSTDGTTWDEIGRVQDVSNFPVTQVIPGATYYVKVVSYNAAGTPSASPPTASISLQAWSAPPEVRGQEIFNQGNNQGFIGNDCKIQWKMASYFAGLGSGGLGHEGAGLGQSLARYIKDTRVSVYVNDTEVRTEFVPAPGNTYDYTLEKNIEDNGTAQRNFEFRLWYRDHYNNESPKYGFLAVSNPAPSMAGLSPTVTAIYNGLRVDWFSIYPEHHDIDKFNIYCETSTPPTVILSRVDRNTTVAYLTGLDATQLHYVKVVPGDSYGEGTSSEIVSQTPSGIPGSQFGVDELSDITVDCGILTDGELQSDNWAAAAGFQIDLKNNTIKIGGSSAPLVEWDGTTFELNAATIPTSGTLTLTGHNSTPALIKFDSNVDLFMGADASNGYLAIYSATDGSGRLFIGRQVNGTTDARFDQVNIYVDDLIFLRTEDASSRWATAEVQSGAAPEFLAEVYYDATYRGDIRLAASSTECRITLDSQVIITESDVMRPNTVGACDLGSDSYYYNEIFYKELTDKGCLGVFDQGVELRDGRIVSDVEALKSIQADPKKQTVYGVPMFDYRTMPEAVYKPASRRVDKPGEPKRKELLPRDENDEPYDFDEKGNKFSVPDGAEMTSLVSIMIGAIKELDSRIEKMEGENGKGKREGSERGTGKKHPNGTRNN